jgi:hypothetical protein
MLHFNPEAPNPLIFNYVDLYRTLPSKHQATFKCTESPYNKLHLIEQKFHKSCYILFRLVQLREVHASFFYNSALNKLLKIPRNAKSHFSVPPQRLCNETLYFTVRLAIRASQLLL